MPQRLYLSSLIVLQLHCLVAEKWPYFRSEFIVFLSLLNAHALCCLNDGSVLLQRARFLCSKRAQIVEKSFRKGPTTTRLV